MADRCHMCLLRLIILCPLLTGTSGAEVTRVFSSSGENVCLPCNNALSGCTSTTWNYNARQSVTDELIAGGNVKNNIERLSLGSDCSLNIKNVTQEDYGLYTCRQYENGHGPQQGTDAPVYLHVLHISSSSSQTEIRPGSVTLSCQLYSYEVSCDTLVRTEELQLIWVNKAGVNLMTDSRYQILFSLTHCISTLTTTLLNEDPNRELRCQVTQRNQPKTSDTCTVKYSGIVVPLVSVGVVAALAVLILAVVFWRIRKKNTKADNKRGTDDDSVEQKDDVIYTEVATYSKKQAKENEVHGDDKVTYASIR